MNGPENVFLGFLVESGVKGAPPQKKDRKKGGKKREEKKRKKKNTGEKYFLPLSLTPPKTTEGLFMSY